MSTNKPNADTSHAAGETKDDETSGLTHLEILAREFAEAGYTHEEFLLSRKHLSHNLDCILRAHIAAGETRKNAKEKNAHDEAGLLDNISGYTYNSRLQDNFETSTSAGNEFVTIDCPPGKSASNYNIENGEMLSTLGSDELERVIEFFDEDYAPGMKFH